MNMEQEQTGAVGQPEGLVDDILSTPTLALPPTPPEAHRGVIDGLTYAEFESGASAIKVALSSTDVPTVTDELAIFIPKNFAADIHVDPNSLPGEEGNNQRQQYSIGISNPDGTATLQDLRRIAYEQERTTAGLEAPHTIEEFVGVLNALLTGVQVVFTRRPQTKSEDPRFRNKLRASAIMNPNTVNNPKALKKYVKMWEGQ